MVFDGSTLWQALALVLVIEGLLPMLVPGRWRRTFEQLLSLNDGQLRFFGLLSVGLGLTALWLLAKQARSPRSAGKISSLTAYLAPSECPLGLRPGNCRTKLPMSCPLRRGTSKSSGACCSMLPEVTVTSWSCRRCWSISRSLDIVAVICPDDLFIRFCSPKYNELASPSHRRARHRRRPVESKRGVWSPRVYRSSRS